MVEKFADYWDKDKVSIDRIIYLPIVDSTVRLANLKSGGLDLIAIPGGFSYGDYLRCGAMAAHSPIMREVRSRADRGTPVLGICNGFQVLTEAGMLPGALLPNRTLTFI